MASEEAFQRTVADSMKDTAVALATTAGALRSIEQRLERNEKDNQRIADGVQALDRRMDGKIEDHDKRIASLEGSVERAVLVAKWFFGGGLLAACGSAYFLYQLVNSLGSILQKLPSSK